jgi:hypothetical protein
MAYNLVAGVTHYAGVPYWFTNNPVHLVATNDGSLLSLYVDGVLSAQTPTGATSSLTTTINTGQAIEDNITSMTVWGMGTWDRVLSGAEIAAWYAGTTPGGPTGFWPATEGTGNTCFNVGGSAGIDMSINSGTLRWSTDRTAFSVTGSVPASTSLLPSDPAASSSVFDGDAANYIFGEYYDWTGPDRILEFWIRPTAYQPADRTAIFSTQYQGIIDIKNLRLLAGGEDSSRDVWGLELNKTYHVVMRLAYQNLIHPHAVWINGRLVGKQDHLTNSVGIYGEQPLYIGQFFNGISPVAGRGLIGELQEFASYAGVYGNEFANKHYNAGIDVAGYSSTLLSVTPLGSSLFRANFSKPTYGAEPENFTFIEKTVEERYTLALVDVLGILQAAAESISSGVNTISLVEASLLALVGDSTITENESYQILKKVDIATPVPYKIINNFDGTIDIYAWRKRPLVYLKLDEASGTDFADSSGNGYDGYSVGTVTAGAVGIVSRAAAFSNASTQYITVPSSRDMTSGIPKGFSVNFWINMSTTAGTTKYIISRQPAVVQSGGWAIYANGTDLFVEYAGFGAGFYSAINISPLAITPGVWHMVTVVYNPYLEFARTNSEPVRDNSVFIDRFFPGNTPAELCWYSNGVFVSKSSVIGIGYDPEAPLVIGNRADALSDANGFPGSICEVSYFDYALTADEIYFLARTNSDHRHMPTVNTPPDGRVMTLTTTNLTDALNDPLLVADIDFINQVPVNDEVEWEGAELVDGFELISSGETTIISNTIIYNMRAYDATLGRYVSWTAEDSPDFSGTFYTEGNPADLTDIILFKTAVQE